jgi:ABC-type transport system involved in multi-copper enzyme maturation permease subunit
MIRLFQIEWIKLRSYRAFKILVALYFLVVVLVCGSGMFILEYLRNQGVKAQGIDPTMLPIYDFGDIWQNLTEAALWLKIILAFIVIISITNEITFKTLRQNIIDGLNRKEFVLSKTIMIFGFSLANTLLVFILGLVLGLIYSHTGINHIFTGIEFIGGFFISTFAYLLFAFFVALLIKRTGIAIVFFGIYAAFIDMITSAIFANAPLPLAFKQIAPFFPVDAINNIIRSPFLKYGFQEIKDFMSFTDVGIVLLEASIFISLIFLLLKRKDL